MKNVKKILIFTALSTFIMAGTIRTNALGGAQYWEDDYSNIWNFPADVNNHNVAYTTGAGMTSIWNDGGTTWGVTVGGDANANDDMFNIMWGNGDMGVTWKVSKNGENGDLGQRIGFGMGLAGGNFGFTTNTKNHSVSLRRAQDVWVFNTMNLGLSMLDVKNTAGNKMELNCGMYNNKSYDGGTSSLYAVNFQYGDQDGGDAKLIMTSTLAVESAFTDWATLRVGYTHGYDLMGTDGTDSGDDALSVGLGFNYGSFSLDLTASDALFTDPVSYMTGQNIIGEGTSLGSAFEVSYTW